jgi:predicted phage tail protein
MRIPYGQKGCFAKGVLVSTPTGEVPIESIQIGDKVLSFNSDGDLQESVVLDLIRHEPLEVWKYTFWGRVSVEATPSHWILNQFNTFAEIGNLTEEDCVINHDGHLLPLISAVRVKDQVTYNLSVSPNHTYIANGIRVHNGGRRGDLRGLPRGRKGSKGKGGGGARAATEAPNTLQSKATASVLDVLSEGEILGLVDGQKSILFDETPLENDNGELNFQNIVWDIRYGLPDQEYMKGFPAAEAENSVSQLVTHAIPVIKTINSTSATSARVTIRLPSLLQQDKSTGDISATEVSIKISVTPNDGIERDIITDTISGKTNSPWNKSYKFELPGQSPWAIKLTKVSADAADLSIQKDVYWDSYTEIIDHKFIYPDTAYIGLSVDSLSFDGRVPSRSYDLYGIICKIPTNYDPIAKTYTGLWDGSFKRAWTDNNAWILYDVITTPRYWGDGSDIFGSVITDEQVDKYSFYDAGQYCDELIPDGKGGMEPRFTFNASIFEREDAFNVLQAIASSFRAMIFWCRGQIMISVDRPGDADKLITEANVFNGQITYQGSSLSSRHTQAIASYNEPSDGYHAAVAIYENQEKRRKYGTNTSDTVAYGCTRKSQAWRWAAWIVETEWAETQTATFEVTFDEADLMPGQLIKIADRTIAGFRGGGRIVSATYNTIVLDDTVTLEFGQTYTLSVMLPSGKPEDRTVVNGIGNTNTLILDSDLPEIPNSFGIWILGSNSVQPRMFRVVSIIENEKNRFQVTALYHDPTKYDRIEQNIHIEEPNYSNLPTGSITPPSNLVVAEKLYQDGSVVRSSADISWTPSTDSRVSLYEVQISTPTVAFLTYETTSLNYTTLQDTTQGLYSFRVRGVSSAGQVSSWISLIDINILALSAPPADVNFFDVSILGTTAYLNWDIGTELNVKYYQIKFAPSLTGVTWTSSSVLVNSISPGHTSITVPAMVGTYLIKAVSFLEVESINATLVVTNTSSIENLNVVYTFNEEPTWAGTKSGVLVSGINELFLDSTDDITDWVDVSLITNVAISGEILDTGEYTFSNYVDLGGIFTSRVTPQLSIYGEDFAALTVDQWIDISTITDISSNSSSGFGSQLQIAVSDLAHPAGYGAWQNFVIGDYTARSMKFKLILYSYNPTVTPKVQSASISIDMPDRVDGQNNVNCPIIGLTITYNPAFKQTPAFVISGSTMATGDYYTLSAETATSVTVQFFNSSNIAISRNFNWVARGWGYVT